MPSLREYQEQAADFFYATDNAMMLAPVGAGKTATAATAMRDAIRDQLVRRWLVLAPKRVARDVWPIEVPKWAPGLSVTVALGSADARIAAFMSPSDVVVMNYDNLQWLCDSRPDLLRQFDGVIFDELTRLKNASGERFKSLWKHIDNFGCRWGLTGSFTSNGLEDVFGQCKIVDKNLLGRSKGAFMQQYFLQEPYKDYSFVPRPSALAEVMARIKPAVYMLDPGEYADQLPPVHVVDIPAEMPTQLDALYRDMKNTYVIEYAESQVSAINAGVMTGKLQQLASGFVYDQGEAARFSNHKLDALDDLVDECQRANMLVWYWYKEELEMLREQYPQAETIDAPHVITRWNSGEVPMLILHPTSAGHGLNLQFGGNIMCFMTMPWSLELYEQGIGRLHRSGQKHDVWVYRIVTKNTVDEDIAVALAERKQISVLAEEILREGVKQ